MNSRSQRAKINSIVSFITQILTLICGILIPRFMIEAFGSEAYGATSSIGQFLAYITLLEGGVGGVARAVLYKPLAQKDDQTVSAIMGEVKRFFRVIAVIFAVQVLVVAVSFKSISHIECMDWITTFLLVFAISISTFGQYFIGISHSILLQAAQKVYVTNLVSIAATILNTISIVVLIGFDCDLIVVKLVSSIIFVMRPIALSLYVRKHYGVHKKPKLSKTKYLTQKWAGLSQHVAYFLHSNTDIAILTLLADLRVVAVYTVYNMVITHLQSLVISFASGMEAMFGDMLARNEKDSLHKTFQTYEAMLSVVSVAFFSVAFALILPFIKLYTAGITDVDYIQPLFAVLLIVTAMSYCWRQPYHSIVIAAGHFKQTRMAAYGEAAINIGLSIVLVLQFGLVGVAIGTLAATWFRFVYYVFYLSKNIFDRAIKFFIKRLMINLISFGINCGIGYGITLILPTDNYLQWVICGAVLIMVVGVSTFLVNCIFYREESRVIFKKLVKR